jgi:hypothetical protein
MDMPTDTCEAAIQRAVVDFWSRVKDFTLLGVPQSGWDQVGPNHPCISVQEGRLVCGGPGFQDG